MKSCCFRCGNASEKTEYGFLCKQCGFRFYKHSSPTGSVLILRGEKVLLAVRGIEPKKGTVDLVGGFLNYGEHPKDGAIREMKEETGLDVEIIEQLGIYIGEYVNQGEKIKTLNVVYIGDADGEGSVSDDVADLIWVDIMNPPIERFGFEMLKDVFDDLQKWNKKNN